MIQREPELWSKLISLAGFQIIPGLSARDWKTGENS